MQNNKKNGEIKDLLLSAKNYLDLNEIQNAAKLYNDIIKIQPTNLIALENLGIIMAKTGNNHVAEKIFRQIINIYPNRANAHNNLSNVLDSLGQNQDAIIHIEKALELEKNNIDFLGNYARLLVLNSRTMEAYDVYKKIHDLDKYNTQIIENLVELSTTLHPDETVNYLKKLNDLNPKAAVKISLETNVPMYFNSQQEIDNFRENYLKNLDYLQSQNLGSVSAEDKFFQTYFYFAYHNRNNKIIKTKLAQLYKSKIDYLNYTSQHCLNYKFDNSKKIKVGFISSFFHKHPVSQCFTGIVTELSKDNNFDVNVFYYGAVTHNKDDEYLQKLNNSKIKIFTIAENNTQIREVISKQELDVLIYLDIGMHRLSYQVAFSRLAPIQVLMPGHPDTTGLDTIDYYFTAKDLEAENGQDFYSEKLVIFDNIPTYIEKPKMPDVIKSRKELGLPEDKKIYYCPMKNQKFHPDFDYAIKRILEADGNAIFMVPKDAGKISDLTNSRIEKNIGKDLSSRIFYHGWASNQDFISYLKTADVVLDTFYFGAGTTVYYALMADAPMVTLPGNTTGGRVLNAAYRRIDMQELIPIDQNDYINKAIKIANDAEYKDLLSEKIRSRKDKLFNNAAFVDELKGFLVEKLKKTNT